MILECNTLDILRHVEVKTFQETASSFNNFICRTYETKAIQVPEEWFILCSMRIASINTHALELNVCHDKYHTDTYCDLIENVGLSWPPFDYLRFVISVDKIV